MNYLKRKMFALPASIAFAAVYYALPGNPWRLDLATCAGFTVAIFVNARRKRGKMPFFKGEDAINVFELILGHTLCLIVLVGIVEIGSYGAPLLPTWLTTPIGTSPGGHPLPSALRYIETLMLFLLGFVESWWLSSGKSDLVKGGRKVTWGRTALEQELSTRLRLK